MSEQFIGRWKLKSIEVHRGDQVIPDTRPLVGFILYLKDGYMSVQMMVKERGLFASNYPLNGTPKEYVDAGKTYLGYSGTYEIQRHTVIHTVEMSSFPNYVGTQLIRDYKFEGDRLTLSVPPRIVDGQPQTTHLVWEKVSEN
jgi:hypothetical protein